MSARRDREVWGGCLLISVQELLQLKKKEKEEDR